MMSISNFIRKLKSAKDGIFSSAKIFDNDYSELRSTVSKALNTFTPYKTEEVRVSPPNIIAKSEKAFYALYPLIKFNRKLIYAKGKVRIEISKDSLELKGNYDFGNPVRMGKDHEKLLLEDLIGTVDDVAEYYGDKKTIERLEKEKERIFHSYNGYGEQLAIIRERKADKDIIDDALEKGYSPFKILEKEIPYELFEPFELYEKTKPEELSDWQISRMAENLPKIAHKALSKIKPKEKIKGKRGSYNIANERGIITISDDNGLLLVSTPTELMQYGNKMLVFDALNAVKGTKQVRKVLALRPRAYYGLPIANEWYLPSYENLVNKESKGIGFGSIKHFALPAFMITALGGAGLVGAYLHGIDAYTFVERLFKKAFSFLISFDKGGKLTIKPVYADGTHGNEIVIPYDVVPIPEFETKKTQTVPSFYNATRWKDVPGHQYVFAPGPIQKNWKAKLPVLYGRYDDKWLELLLDVPNHTKYEAGTHFWADFSTKGELNYGKVQPPTVYSFGVYFNHRKELVFGLPYKSEVKWHWFEKEDYRYRWTFDSTVNSPEKHVIYNVLLNKAKLTQYSDQIHFESALTDPDNLYFDGTTEWSLFTFSKTIKIPEFSIPEAIPTLITSIAATAILSRILKSRTKKSEVVNAKV